MKENGQEKKVQVDENGFALDLDDLLKDYNTNHEDDDPEWEEALESDDPALELNWHGVPWWFPGQLAADNPWSPELRRKIFRAALLDYLLRVKAKPNPDGSVPRWSVAEGLWNLYQAYEDGVLGERVMKIIKQQNIQGAL